MNAIVVGTGFVGGLIADALAAGGHRVHRVSARALLAGTLAAESAEDAGICFFAHGKSVGVRGFAAHFDELLASRVGVFAPAAALPGFAAQTRVVLISSTVACLDRAPAGARDLPALQRRCEAAFLDVFPSGIILRVGAIFGPGSQIEVGLPLLARTRVLKRIRMRSATDIPWIDGPRLAQVCLRMAETSSNQSLVVANPEGFDLNTVLDRAYDGRWTLRLPVSAFLGLYGALGMPRQFATVTMDDVRRSRWDIVSA